MLSILMLYPRGPLGLGDSGSKEVGAPCSRWRCTPAPAGAFIADRWWGRYQMIPFLASFCRLDMGFAVMEGSRNESVSGPCVDRAQGRGIKPCVSAFVGDQFRADQMHPFPKGVRTLLLVDQPGDACFRPRSRWSGIIWFGLAFGIPGVFMALATLVFLHGLLALCETACRQQRRKPRRL